MSPRNKKINQEILDKRREQILNTALKVFAHKGYSATKISDIAIAAGLSQGLLYHYFKTKDEVFTELFKNSFVITGIPGYTVQQDISPFEKIKNIVNMIISMAFEGDGLYYWHIVNQAYISEAIPVGVKEIIGKKKSALSDSIIPIIIEGQKLGQIAKDDPLKLYTTFYSILNGLAMQVMRSRNIPDYPILLPDADIIMRIFRIPDNDEKVSIFQNVKRQFGQIKFTNKHLVYRFRESVEDDFKIVNISLSEIIERGIRIYRIESVKETGEILIALIRADDLQPLTIEIKNSRNNIISGIEYMNNSVFFNIPERNIHKEIKLNGEYYDGHTLVYILQEFPFESNEKIKFILVMDGTQGPPVGPYGMEIQMVGRERIIVPAGNLECYKLEMTPAGLADYKYYYWFLINEPHTFIKYEGWQGDYRELVKFE
jgi:hypothetical protein